MTDSINRVIESLRARARTLVLAEGLTPSIESALLRELEAGSFDGSLRMLAFEAELSIAYRFGGGARMYDGQLNALIRKHTPEVTATVAAVNARHDAYAPQGTPDAPAKQRIETGRTGRNASEWTVYEPQKWDELTRMVYAVLKTEHSAEKPRPKAMFVMEAIERNKYPDFYALERVGGLVNRPGFCRGSNL